MPSLGSPNDNIDSIIINNNNHKNNNGHGNNNNGHRHNNNVIKIHHRHSAHLPLIHTNYNCSRRYAEVGLWRRSVEDVHKGIPLTSPFIRGDAFLEPYMQGLGAEPPLHRPPPIAPKPLLSPSPTTLEQTESTDEVDGGSSCGEESSRGSSDASDQIPCDIGLMERLIRSHPVWFLPGIQRAGAFHLLQGKEEGNFVVRQSSQSSTMAISVRLPSGKGPYIEHYLIQAASEGHLSLESSENNFPSIPALIAHYSQCCDELPVQLTLPRAIRDAKNRQQLSSLALLGQEFWRYPMANPRPAQTCADQGGQPEQTGLNSSLPSSQASSLTSFGSGNNNQTGRSPTGEPDAIVLNLSPLSDQAQTPGLLSTFKGTHPPESAGSPTTWFAEGCDSPTEQLCNVSALPRAPRPTPPNTLNLGTTSANSTTANSKSVSSPPSSLGMVPLKTPPPPPPRWSKPFTVTTTVTFSMTETTSSTASPPTHHVELLSHQKRGSLCESDSLASLQSGTATLESVRGGGAGSSKSPVSEQLSPSQAVSPVGSEQPRSAVMSPTEPRSAVMSPTEPRSAVMSPTEPRSAALSPASSESRSVLSPVSDSKPPHRRSKRHKESRHYQESDILESPTVYYRSSVADKVSDYEDIWGPESLTTFKPTRSSPFTPTEEARRVPDILDRVPPCPAPRPSLTVAPAPSPTEQPPSTPVEQQAPATNKQSSPFYCEPADAIKSAAMEVARRRNRGLHKTNRHSDPSALLQWPALAPGGMLERIDSKEELSLTGLSSSVDNLIGPRKLGRRIGLMERGKGNKPKLAKRPQGNNFSDTSWAVDSSWEFIGNEEEQGSEQEDTPEEGYLADRRFPSLEQQENDQSPAARGVTVQELIAERCPELRLPTDFSVRADKSDSSGNSGSRVSAYDNVTNNQNGGASSQSHISDDDTQTIFSEPWDSSRWETLLERGDDWSRGEERVAIVRTKSFKERLDPLLCAPRLAALQRTRRESGGTGATIRNYTLHLASDKSTVFSRTIDHFISCTRESKECRPQVVMRNMRQFMTGMKNYLVTHGEGEFERHVEKERNKLRANEFLNLDAILEGVMHKLVVRPLREHLYRLFVDEYTQSGAIQLLADNIKYARTKTPRDIGIRPNVIPPSEEAMEEICSYLQKLQEVDSPLEKLENLLTSIASIFNYVKVTNHPRTGLLLGADDFLPLFVWVLVQSGMVAAEIEADYMWGLLHPSLLSGEGGYYLTTLSSAVHVLKSFRACSEECSAAGAPLNWGPGPLSEFRSVLKIVVPDELNGSIITKTLPIRPNMTTKDVCKIIAHKVRITNPQDYGLYKLVDGEETVLTDGECPQDVKGTVSGSGKHCMFAYKRIDAKIAWPKNQS